MQLVAGDKNGIAMWAGLRLKTLFHEPFEAIGIVDASGALVGAAIFNDYTGPNVELTLVAPRALSRAVLRGLAQYAFDWLHAVRVSVHVRAGDRRTIELAIKAGFRTEGVRRRFFGGASEDDDAICFGMLKDECRYLKREVH